MAKVIAVHSMKGGVGKSSLAVNLAHASASAGLRTLLWDLDAQGGATYLLAGAAPTGGKTKAKRAFAKDGDPGRLARPTAYAGLDLIAADLSLRQLEATLAEADKPGRLKKLLSEVQRDYDVILLDCPPGLGELSDQTFRAADLIVVPLVPAPLALRTLDQMRAHHGAKGPPLLPVFSMVDRRKTLHREALTAHPDWPVIPMASVVEQMAVEQRPLATFAGKSEAARAVAEVWQAAQEL